METSLNIVNSRINQSNIGVDNIHCNMPQLNLKVKLLVPSAKAPKRALPLDNGMDIYLSNLNEFIPGEDQQFSFETHTTGCKPVYDEQGKIIGIDIMPGGMAKLPLGFAASFNPFYGAFIFDKSGVGAKGIKYLGGVVESEYRKNYWVMLANIKTADEFYPMLTNRIQKKDYKDNTVRFLHGQKLAQIVYLPVCREEAKIVSELDETERKSGFGSTGEF